MSFFSTVSSLFAPRMEIGNVDISALFNMYARAFGIESAESYIMARHINDMAALYQNSRSQMMKVVCKEAAKLTLTDYKVSAVTDNPDNAQPHIAEGAAVKLIAQLNKFLELGVALGGLMLKPNQRGITIVSPLNFIPVAYDDDGNITAVIFIDRARKGNTYFTRLEYHHWLGEDYCIDTRAFKARNEYELGFSVELQSYAPWANIEPQVTISNLKTPLFSYFRMPGANNVDLTSPLGISIAAGAVDYLLSFDRVYDRFKEDMETLRRSIFVSHNVLLAGGIADKLKQREKENGNNLYRNPIPNLIVGLNGSGDIRSQLVEFNPTSNVMQIKEALQVNLNMISIACGFTSGYFSYDVNKGVVTATQVEAENSTTVATITAIRQSLNTAIEQAIAGYVELFSLYSRMAIAPYSLVFYSRDLSATPVADRERVVNLVRDGLYPLDKYLKEFEGLSDAEVQAFLATRNSQGTVDTE